MDLDILLSAALPSYSCVGRGGRNARTHLWCFVPLFRQACSLLQVLASVEARLREFFTRAAGSEFTQPTVRPSAQPCAFQSSNADLVCLERKYPTRFVYSYYAREAQSHLCTPSASDEAMNFSIERQMTNAMIERQSPRLFTI